LKEVPFSKNTTTDTAVVANTPYSYTVSAVDVAGNESVQTAAVSVTTPPMAPTLADVIVSTNTTVTLSITNSIGAEMCNVYRGGVLLASVPVAGGATKVWIDGAAPLVALTPNTQYCYALRAVSPAGAQSALTAQKCYATTP
jgi:hypothetical protein